LENNLPLLVVHIAQNIVDAISKEDNRTAIAMKNGKQK